MATIRVRYLVSRPGRPLPRWFWQPSPELRALGYLPRRVPEDFARFTDAAALEMAAIRAAQALNAALDAARAGRASVAPSLPAPAMRTLGDLIDLYQASDAYRSKASKTKQGYAQCLAILRAKAGDAPVLAIDAQRVESLQRGMRKTPAYANAVVRVLRLLLEFGRRKQWLAVNPAIRPALVTAAPTGIIWPQAAVTAFVAAADAMKLHSIGTAVLLNAWFGQREGDILRMPRAVLRGEGANRVLVARQGKTAARVTLPVGMVPHLAQRLAEELERVARYNPMPATIIVSEATKRPYKGDHFRHEFARIRAEAAKTTPTFEVDHLAPGMDMADAGAFQVRMEDLTFMRLRHTAVTRLAEAGCDIPQIGAVTGHSLDTITSLMKRYLVRTGEMTRVAFQKRMDAEGKG